MRRWTAFVYFTLALAIAGCGAGGVTDGGITDSDPSNGGDSLTTARIAPHQTVEGQLTPVDLQYVDVDPASGDISHFETYEITLETSGILTVLMQSSEVDSYLQLFDATFLDDPTDDTAFIAASDDRGSTLHSMISEELPAGTYVIVASTAFANLPDTGSYALTTLFTE
jgi:hypothetical protein